MYRKLMKYEWKAMWRVLLIINAFTIFVTLLGIFAMNSLLTQNSSDSAEYAVIAMLIFMLYYATIIGVSFAISIYIAIRFYRSMYTDEGYLMHTLPVTKRQLVVSRLLVHTLCSFITGVLVLLSVAVLLIPLMTVITEEPGVSLISLYQAFAAECQSVIGMSLPVFVLMILITTIIGTLSGNLAIYCGISLGQTFHKHKVIGSILCYIGITCVLQILSTFLMMPQLFSTVSGAGLNMTNYLSSTMMISSASALISGIIFYLITLYMMNRKLNLD